MRDERGFTLVELLVGMAIGMIVLFAAFGLMDLSITRSRETEARMQAVSRGRVAFEDLTRQLRSQTCFGDQAAVIDGQPTTVTFYASLDRPTISGQLPIEMRQLSFEASSPGRGDVVERIWRQQAGSTMSAPIWPSTPVTRTVVNDVRLLGGTQPFLRFYKYDKTLSPNMVELTSPISANDRALIVKISVGFDSYPDGGGEDKRKTVYQGDVFVRTADPTDPEYSPRCI